MRKEVEKIFQEQIDSGKTQTRESKDNSLDKFVRTKVSDLRDYTDACYRYLRATGMVEISQRGNSLSIMYEKKQEVEFFLDHVDRKPIFVDDGQSIRIIYLMRRCQYCILMIENGC